MNGCVCRVVAWDVTGVGRLRCLLIHTCMRWRISVCHTWCPFSDIPQLSFMRLAYRNNYYMAIITVAVLTYRIRGMSTPSYLSRHIRLRGSARHLRLSAVPLLYKPPTRTPFADRAFRCTAATVWNSLAIDVTSSCSLTVFKSRLKTHIFRQAFNLSD